MTECFVNFDEHVEAKKKGSGGGVGDAGYLPAPELTVALLEVPTHTLQPHPSFWNNNKFWQVIGGEI